MDDPVLIAVPVFFALILIELVASLVAKRRLYRLNDSINNISTGVIQQVLNVVTRGIALTGYVAVYSTYHAFELPSDSVLVWICALFLYDFLDYWGHRATHRINVLWGWHQVHHQSEDYNLSLSLRQPALPIFWIFFVPMALLGVHPAVYLSVGIVDLFYQYWLHTEFVRKLPILDSIFMTPSNHRVHHGQNPLYVDKNYGAIFIIWDRMFGTYQEELDDQEAVYGIRDALRSWNPIWANLKFLSQLFRDARRARRLWDKVRIWFMPTGWRPPDVSAADPIPETDLASFEKYDPGLPRGVKAYCAFQFALALASAIAMLVGGFEGWSLWLGSGLLMFWLFAIGKILENDRRAGRWEGARLGGFVALLGALLGWGGVPWWMLAVGAGYVLLTALLLLSLPPLAPAATGIARAR